MGKGICSITDCGRPHNARGWCRKHYERWKRLGFVADQGMTWTVTGSSCAYCGGAVPSGGKYRRWCGRACADAARRGRPKSRACTGCGAEFSLMVRSPRKGRLVKSDRTRCDDCPTRPNHLEAYIPALIERDGLTCGICSLAIDLTVKWPHPRSRSVDHVIPRSVGGPDDLSNYQLACLGCNCTKRAQLDFQINPSPVVAPATDSGSVRIGESKCPK